MSKCDPFRSKTEFKGKKQKRSQGSSHYRPKAPTELTLLPPLRDAPPNEQQELFIKKLQQCCVVFDFSDALTDTQSKEIKRNCLSELVEYVTVTRGVLNESTYQDIIRMVCFFVMNSFFCLYLCYSNYLVVIIISWNFYFQSNLKFYRLWYFYIGFSSNRWIHPVLFGLATDTLQFWIFCFQIFEWMCIAVSKY